MQWFIEWILVACWSSPFSCRSASCAQKGELCTSSAGLLLVSPPFPADQQAVHRRVNFVPRLLVCCWSPPFPADQQAVQAPAGGPGGGDCRDERRTWPVAAPPLGRTRTPRHPTRPGWYVRSTALGGRTDHTLITCVFPLCHRTCGDSSPAIILLSVLPLLPPILLSPHPGCSLPTDVCVGGGPGPHAHHFGHLRGRGPRHWDHCSCEAPRLFISHLCSLGAPCALYIVDDFFTVYSAQTQ